MLYNSFFLLALISIATALPQSPPAPEPSKNVTRPSGVVNTRPRIPIVLEEPLGRPLVNPGLLIPVVGAVVSDRMRDRHNCGVRPDLGFGGFFEQFDSHSLLIGDGKVLNGTQGQELVTNGCKTMIPEGGPRKLYVPPLKMSFFVLF